MGSRPSGKLLSVGLAGIKPASPVSIADLKAHQRIEYSEEDSHLQVLVNSATEWIEGYCSITLASRDLKATFDGFPPACPLFIPRGPVTEITSVEYDPGDGTLLPVAGYRADLDHKPTRILPPVDGWPLADRTTPQPVVVKYKAGYTEASPYFMPSDLKLAILQLAGHWYEHREAAQVVQVHQMPLALQVILEQHHMVEAV